MNKWIVTDHRTGKKVTFTDYDQAFQYYCNLVEEDSKLYNSLGSACASINKQ